MKRQNQRRQPQPYEVQPDSFGKLPPQALEIEEDVLGALMIEAGAMDQVEDILRPEMFYIDKHSKIYEAIEQLHRDSAAIDMHTVVEQLKSNATLEEIGGIYAIAMLTSRASSAAHIVFHAQIIMQKYIAREVIRFTADFQAKAYEESTDVEDILSGMEKRFTEIRMDDISRGVKSMVKVVDETRDYLLELRRAHNKGESAFVRTPTTELDNMLKGGFKAEKLIVVGARPGMGKTQFILETAKKIEKTPGKEAMLFNLEMSAVELCIRLLLEEEAIDDYAVESGTYSNEQLDLIDQKLRMIEKLPLRITDDEYNINGIISKMRKEKRDNPKISAAFIDYLQLIETGAYFQTRDLEVGYITRRLKQVSKELDMAIVLLAQLNRDAKGEPQLQHLRESGNIEQDADVVIFIDRPILREEFNDPDDNTSWEQAGQFIVAKHRQGQTGKVKFSHDKRFKRMFSYVDIQEAALEDHRRAWEQPRYPDKHIEPNKDFDDSPF